MGVMDYLVEDAGRHGVEVPVWLRNVPTDEPEHVHERYRRRWDRITATDVEGV